MDVDRDNSIYSTFVVPGRLLFPAAPSFRQGNRQMKFNEGILFLKMERGGIHAFEHC
jgi:hypothetical protein